jgi:hypothetical protein
MTAPCVYICISEEEEFVFVKHSDQDESIISIYIEIKKNSFPSKEHCCRKSVSV